MINRHLLFNMPEVKTQTGLVLGAGAASAYVALEAAEQYAKGNFKKVIVAGGVKPARDLLRYGVFPRLRKDGLDLPEKDETEAAYIRRIMIMKGVPAVAIRIDEQSENTGQNIENALNLGLGESQSITAITLAYHQRRVFGTIRKHLPDTPVTTKAVYPLGITKDTWQNRVLSRFAVLDETWKMGPRTDGQTPDYIRKGFARVVDMREEDARIADFRKPAAGTEPTGPLV